jgi:hypothetical protein
MAELACVEEKAARDDLRHGEGLVLERERGQRRQRLDLANCCDPIADVRA